MFITIIIFLLLAMINLLTISCAEWKFSAWIDKWEITVSMNEQMLQHMMDSVTGWILQ